MTLTHLPTELLDMIVIHTIPEGFESLARTCQQFHSLCVPFIEQHNALRSRFRRFYYYENVLNSAPTIGMAFDLIARIADEPRITKYIRKANFKIDGLFRYVLYRESVQEVHGNDAVRRLFADSTYLKEAGLDWKIYYAQIEEDLFKPLTIHSMLLLFC